MIRHLFASIITIAVVLAIAVGCFLLFLLSALFSGGDMGGPLAFPMMVLGIVVFGAMGCFLVLTPSVWLAERFSRRAVTALPLALLIALPICCLTTWLLGNDIAAGVPLWGLAAFPLIGYWICVRSMGLVTSAVAAAIGWLCWKWAIRRLPALSAARS